MNYNKQSTEILEKEYNRLMYTNISLLSKDIIETISYNIDLIWAVLYFRKHWDTKLIK